MEGRLFRLNIVAACVLLGVEIDWSPCPKAPTLDRIKLEMGDLCSKIRQQDSYGL